MPNFFSKEAIDEHIKKAEERSEYLPAIDKPGSYSATVEDVVLMESKAGEPMLMISHQIDKEHRTIDSYFVLTNQVGASRLVEWVFNAFGQKLKPVDTENKTELGKAIFAQVIKAKGKKLEVAVKVKEELYEAKEKVMVVNKPDIWFVGKSGTKLTVNLEKAFVPLSKEDKAKLAEKGDIADKSKQASEEDDPFTDDKDSKKETEKKSKPADKKEPVKKDEPAEEDPW